MARSAVLKAEVAAATLDAFLRDRPRPGGGGPAAQQHAEADRAAGDQAEAASSQRRRARDQPSGPVDLGGLLADGADAPLCPAHTDWLSHRLMVTGPAAAVAGFGNAAAGAGSIPWQLDLDSLAEDWFHRLVDPAHRTLSLAGAQVLASQLRDAVEHRQAVALARVGHSRACPFDLHALLPVPAAILQHGPDHPAALAWLWQHWGTTQALRHVAVDTTPAKGVVLPPLTVGDDRLRLCFWSADWTPWRALARLQAEWPALRFAVQPEYDAG